MQPEWKLDRVMSRQAGYAERHNLKAKNEPQGKAWVIMVRARGGVEKSANRLTYVLCDRENSGSIKRLTNLYLIRVRGCYAMKPQNLGSM